MVQEILIGIIFLAALFYVGSIFYKNAQAKNGCAKGCGSCGAVDFKKIESDLELKKQYPKRDIQATER